ncbi:MAG: LLM class flavin-dependent oxidoreductase [Microbacteriaceae bacterium]|nr:LLM class flavin-dependent oxidoreductase [Microbacteriaceae bacterium]
MGTVFLPAWPTERLLGFARATEDAGLHDLWLWEDCFKQSGPAAAGAALASTRRIRVGIGLMPVPLRAVVTTAMEIATLERMFPERFVPVVGHGVQDWMGQAGVRAASPLMLLREYATALRALLDGRTVTAAGEYVRLDGVRLDWPSAGPSRLLLGGEGPKTLDLAAELGDGTMLTSALTEAQIAAGGERVRTITRGRDHELVAHLMVTRGPDARALLDAELADWGRASPDAGIAAESPDEVAASIVRLGEAGVSTVVVHGVSGEPDPEGLVAWIGSEVAPRVAA